MQVPFRLSAALLFVLVFAFTGAVSAQELGGHAHPAPSAKKKAPGKPVERAFGREGDPRRVKRVIKIDMSDTMRYFPDSIRVKRGDTVRFSLRNGGQMMHEMVIGTLDDLKKHAEIMRKESHEMDHDAPYAAHVAPGETGRIVWQFTKPGEFYYACLIPGHFEAGMMGTIVVR